MRRLLMLPTLVAVVAATVFLLLVSAAPPGDDVASAADGGPEMRVIVTDGGACTVDGDKCDVEVGGAFTLAVEVATAPAEGYVGAQSFLVFGHDLTYKPADFRADENVWPDCEAELIRIDFLPQGELNHGCFTGFISPVPSTYAGILWELSFNCSEQPSSTLVELVPLGEDPAGTSGTGFATESDQIPAKVSNLTIQCASKPEMRLVVKEGGDCDGERCVVEIGGKFTMVVEVVTAPTEPYLGAHSFMIIGPDLVYKPTEIYNDEIIWPGCWTPTFWRDNSPPEELNHGCLNGRFLTTSTYTGVLWELSFNCSEGPSSTLVELVPLGEEPASLSGSGFSTGDGGIAAKVSDLTIQCAAGVEQPTATPIEPTAEPLLLGDANCDGVVNSVDALWILQIQVFAMNETSCPLRADVNGDGISDSLDASLVLQFSAGLIEALA